MPQPLRIAMLVPPYTDLPPAGYGGTESVVAALVDELVDRGHDVVLLGVGHNGTKARFVQLRAQPQSDRMGQLMPELVHVASAAAALDQLDVDIVHDHTAAGHLVAPLRRAPTITTVHGPVGPEERAVLDGIRAVWGGTRLVAISEDQRSHAPDLPWVGTVHHGVRVLDRPCRTDRREGREHVLFLGRMTPEKGCETAIQAAREAEVDLVIAAKCREAAEELYFEQHVKPHLGAGVTWLGEVDEAAKLELLMDASCLLFPIQWDEPFGLVMIEALACGTPVVAMERGSVGEVLEDGITGLLADSDEDVPRLLREVGSLRPEDCRHAAETRFDIPRMAADYERVYREAIKRRPQATPRAVS